MKNKITPEFVLNNIVFPCMRGSYLVSERPQLEGVHAALCAKEIAGLINNGNLVFERRMHQEVKDHNQGKKIVINWAKLNNLDFDVETDISVGVADVIVYADDIGIFEIGTTRPTKMLLLIKYICRERRPMSIHFWPYSQEYALIFRNWK